VTDFDLHVENHGRLTVERGRARFIAREPTDATVPSGRKIPEMAQLDAWGTPLKL
jgi:hypothetical protein